MKIKNTFLFLLVLAIACISTSCSENEFKFDPADGHLAFSGIIGESLNTKAADNTWAANDGIGLYMKEQGQELQTGILNEARNIQYTTATGDGVFVAVNPAEAIFYPKGGIAVDFIAYYPYQAVIPVYTYKINLADQANQTSIDLLYSDNAKNFNSSMSNVGLVFTHKLSKILINVTSTKGLANIAGLKVVTSGMMTKGEMSLGTGLITPEITSAADIAFLTSTGTDKIVAEAIVLPGDATAGRKISFTYGSKEFSWPIPDGTIFEGGKRYTYNAELEEGTVVIINPGATIEDWDDVSGENIDVEFDDVPPAITTNQTGLSLNGVDVGTTISLEGDIKSVFNLATAKLITITAEGIETEIDLLEGVSGSTLNFPFKKDIVADAALRGIRIEATDTNNQTTTINYGVYVGYYYYNLYVTGPGYSKFPESAIPFLSAEKGQAYGFEAASGLSEFMDVGFTTFSTDTRITAHSIAKVNAGKFKHPTIAWRPESWTTRKDVQLGAAVAINRNNITGMTLADIQAETALDTGGEMNFFLTGVSLYDPLDLAVLYKTQIGGVDKRVLFAIDKVNSETSGTSIGLYLHVVVEK